MFDDRDHRGRFARGNRGGPGRPKRCTRPEYLLALNQIVSVADLVAIARRAVADAKKGRARARDWVSRYLLGDPPLKAVWGAEFWDRLAESLLDRRPMPESASSIQSGADTAAESLATVPGDARGGDRKPTDARGN